MPKEFFSAELSCDQRGQGALHLLLIDGQASLCDQIAVECALIPHRLTVCRDLDADMADIFRYPADFVIVGDVQDSWCLSLIQAHWQDALAVAPPVTGLALKVARHLVEPQPRPVLIDETRLSIVLNDIGRERLVEVVQLIHRLNVESWSHPPDPEDCQAWARWAHKLKGRVGMIGLPALYQAALTLEASALRRHRDQVRMGIQLCHFLTRLSLQDVFRRLKISPDECDIPDLEPSAEF